MNTKPLKEPRARAQGDGEEGEAASDPEILAGILGDLARRIAPVVWRHWGSYLSAVSLSDGDLVLAASTRLAHNFWTAKRFEIRNVFGEERRITNVTIVYRS